MRVPTTVYFPPSHFHFPVKSEIVQFGDRPESSASESSATKRRALPMDYLRSVVRVLHLSIVLALASLPSTLHSAEFETGVLGEGTEWEVRWYRTTSETPGPTVLVSGGLHGNEPAGYRAAEQIRHWPIVKGSLVVIPR